MRRVAGGVIYNSGKLGFLTKPAAANNLDLSHALVVYLDAESNSLQVIGNLTSKSINQADLQSHVINFRSNFSGKILPQHIVLSKGVFNLNPTQFKEAPKITVYLQKNKDDVLRVLLSYGSTELKLSLKDLIEAGEL